MLGGNGGMFIGMLLRGRHVLILSGTVTAVAAAEHTNRNRDTCRISDEQ
jgi:hypothetical protein